MCPDTGPHEGTGGNKTILFLLCTVTNKGQSYLMITVPYGPHGRETEWIRIPNKLMVLAPDRSRRMDHVFVDF